TGFLEQIPCFEFQGRRFGVDLVGEKLAPETAQQLLSQLNETESKAISLLAIDTQQQVKPFYCVLFEGEIHHSISNEYIDSILRQNFHYELARNLGQLDQPQIRQANNGWNAYKKLVMFDGIIEGNIKPEPLKKVTLNSLEQL
ncbi:GH3 auxin-responsive promoter family protein, partial [Acinetobacter baumannii]|nr:GH3 auxin-responsive promoter family protein [Acinetobacter baumannii]